MRFWNLFWGFERGLAAIVAGSALFLIIGITVLSVIGRYFFHVDIIPGSYNIIERIIFPILVFAAIPIAHREGIFPRFELIAVNLPPFLNKIIGLIVLTVELAIYGIVFYFCFTFLLRAVESGRSIQIGTDVFPMSPILAIIVLAFGLVAIEALRLVYRDVQNLFKT